MVWYTYTVDGQQHVGKVIKLGGESGNTREEVQWRLDEYPVGKAVQVYVNPRNPKRAVLEPSVSYVAVAVFALFGVPLFCAGLSLLVVFGLLGPR